MGLGYEFSDLAMVGGTLTLSRHQTSSNVTRITLMRLRYSAHLTACPLSSCKSRAWTLSEMRVCSTRSLREMRALKRSFACQYSGPYLKVSTDVFQISWRPTQFRDGILYDTDGKKIQPGSERGRAVAAAETYLKGYHTSHSVSR